MLFNSIEFILFLPIVFLLYWFVFNKSIKLQNAFVIVVSYIFYGWWDWRFLLLIAFTTICSYYSGILIDYARTPPHTNNAKLYAIINIVLNLFVLSIFKYFNFFSENFERLFELFGINLDWVTLDILLPVGISFYTFQAISYTIDVYNNKIAPTRDVLSFFAFVSFFPQLVAGPIERSTNLLPQFYKKRIFDYDRAVDGCRQILWGFFKKMIVADNCAFAVNEIWSDYSNVSGLVLLMGGVFFSFQIYCDFSGYSDIAIGVSRLFGINLLRNFNMPYFSRDIAEFWRKWHISLTTWFRDYIYIPLGGSKCSKLKVFRNTLIIFLVSGFWHGANWTFILWGLYHAILFLPLMFSGKNRKYTNTVAHGQLLPSLSELGRIVSTFVLAMFGWIIFRSDNISQAFQYISHIFSKAIFSTSGFSYATNKKALLGIAILIVVEWLNREKEHGLQINKSGVFYYKPARIIFYAIFIFIIYTFAGGQAEFIYFQF